MSITKKEFDAYYGEIQDHVVEILEVLKKISISFSFRPNFREIKQREVKPGEMLQEGELPRLADIFGQFAGNLGAVEFKQAPKSQETFNTNTKKTLLNSVDKIDDQALMGMAKRFWMEGTDCRDQELRDEKMQAYGFIKFELTKRGIDVTEDGPRIKFSITR